MLLRPSRRPPSFCFDVQCAVLPSLLTRHACGTRQSTRMHHPGNPVAWDHCTFCNTGVSTSAGTQSGCHLCSMSAVLIKMALDQLVMSPLFLVAFFAAVKTLEGQPHKLWEVWEVPQADE